MIEYTRMNKKLIFEALKVEIEKNLKLALAAAQNTYSIATHEDSKAENKYDTRGLEASYLAGAQAERVVDLRDTLGSILNLGFKIFSSENKIALTALVKIQSESKTNWILLLPKGGGQSFKYDEKNIQVVTPESPLGQALIGRQTNDEIQINSRHYEITEVW